jgi:hypothetical protein
MVKLLGKYFIKKLFEPVPTSMLQCAFVVNPMQLIVGQNIRLEFVVDVESDLSTVK